MSQLARIIDQAARKLGRRMRVALPGRIVEYDGATQTATVELQVELPLPKIDARGEERAGEYTHEELPRLHGVPVGHPRGGGFFVHFPLVTGDYVDVLFTDVSLEEFIRSGTVSKPKDVRTHDLFPRAVPTSDPSEANRIADTLPSDEILIAREGGSDIRIKQDDQVHIAGGADFVALAQKVLDELNDIRTQHDNHVHVYNPGPGSPTPTATPTTPMGSASSVAASKVKAS
ncbi:MAG: hypothetical protein GWN84_20550 [Gammaproteobacteria bacterium]|nr:hypothetical protein [Gammaproteobacteria bacterium]NIR85152.1 hypothetical protein [Gammaproteobacteria bacterium]NIU06201.1 hypothetical protein [Gammaproteobacteria bacterium]NIX87474.1 hypothetical protein [Gammaproteobacteria bacterium]